MQAALDTALRKASEEECERFWASIHHDRSSTAPSRSNKVEAAEGVTPRDVIRSPDWLISDDYLVTLRSTRRRVEGVLQTPVAVCEELEELATTVADYSFACTLAPPQAMLGPLTLTFTRASNLLGEKLSQAGGLKVREVMAQGAGLIADELSVLGDVNESKNWHNLAATLALDADKKALLNQLTALSASVDLYHGNPLETLRRVGQLTRGSGGSSSASTVFALALSAVAYAKIGNQELAYSAMSQADRAFDLSSEQERAVSVFGFSERRLLFYRGRALAHLGQMSQAEETYANTRTMYDSQFIGDRLMIELDYATALKGAGDNDESCKVALRALRSLPREHLCGLYLAHARPLTEQSPHGRTGVASELRETVKSLESSLREDVLR